MTSEHSVGVSAVGSSGFDVRLVAPEEIEATVLPLWRKGMSDPQIVNHVQARFEWLYRNNPSGRTCTWVVVDRGSGEVLGACSVVPHRLCIGDSVLRAGQLVDFIVDPKARVAGPAIALQRGLAEQSPREGFELLFGYPNRKAWPIFARAGFKALGGTRMWSRSLQADPPRMRRILARHLARTIPAAWAEHLAAWLGWPLALVAQAGNRALEARQHWRRPGLSGRLQRFQGDVPELGLPATSLLRTDESADHLRWRFGKHPTHHYRLFELHEGSRCVAWAAVRLYVESAEIEAAQWTNGHPALPAALWQHLSATLRREGLHVLSVNLAGSKEVDRSLAACLFVERPDGRQVIMRATDERTTSLLAKLPALKGGTGWHLFAGTLDI